jgi:sodium/potassium-transporting ATPase subunit alpha
LGNPDPQASNLALAVVLLVVVFLQAAFNAWQDFSTSRVMASIQGMLPADVVVLRDGVQTTLPAASLVPGDLVHLVMGQKVPADVKLIDVSGDLRFDRSVLTGEVCHDMRIYARALFFLLTIGGRAKRSQDAWKRRMTISSRCVVSHPSFSYSPCVNVLFQTKNIALQGTLCVNGSGLGLVFQIGDNTVLCV